jgi:peptidyl-prolyl cis-trans isomerase SurA
MYIRNITIALFFTVLATSITAQESGLPSGTLIDGVAAVVGKSTILYSEIEAQYLQYRKMESSTVSPQDAKCSLLEEMIFGKMLLDKAEFDSLTVNENQLQNEMEYRLRYFASQIGSMEKLEDYYGKPLDEIKEELRQSIKEQNMVEMARSEITKSVSTTPSEVKRLFKELPADSIPMVNSEVIIQEIVKQPKVSLEQIIEIKERLRTFRQRVLNGEKFATLAILYSEDPGSASKGGELGYYGRGELYPEFETMAFKLEPGQLSDVVETKAGYHIIEMIDRRGDYINVRHILLRPKVSLEALAQAAQTLDSIAKLINNGTITIDDAVKQFSEGDNKISGGYLVNPNTNSVKWQLNQLDPKLLYVIDKLKEGEVSAAVPFETSENYEAYRLLYLKTKTAPHRATMDTDYDVIFNWALNKKKMSVLEKWVQEQSKKTYIRIDDQFLNCNFKFLNK